MGAKEKDKLQKVACLFLKSFNAIYHDKAFRGKLINSILNLSK
ncbi:hypothetical protein SAMN03097699_3371 [Flavobacteriaceae bacterium MAR_2010_188]|nr:hypothetical protein SAMN03097699_3371 [Flavobacteriaceae bacterium MAR_2010_188]